MDSTKDLQKGQLIKSKSGRDQGRLFLVLDIIDESFVLLVDGDLRKIQSPKKKKVKHIAKINMVSYDLVAELDAGRSITDEWIRREIDKLGLR